MENLGKMIRGLFERGGEVPESPNELLKEIIEAYKEARTYTDEYLFEDRIEWLKNGYEKGWMEFPDDYDFNTSRRTIGFLIAQVERYGGVVIETSKGILPHGEFQPEGFKGTITEE